jgi:hypothetical protein
LTAFQVGNVDQELMPEIRVSNFLYELLAVDGDRWKSGRQAEGFAGGLDAARVC